MRAIGRFVVSTFAVTWALWALVPSGGVQATNPFTLEGTLVFRLTVLVLWAVAAFLLVRMRGVRRADAVPAEPRPLMAV